jgi:hypothetical protein
VQSAQGSDLSILIDVSPDAIIIGRDKEAYNPQAALINTGRLCCLTALLFFGTYFDGFDEDVAEVEKHQIIKPIIMPPHGETALNLMIRPYHNRSTLGTSFAETESTAAQR